MDINQHTINDEKANGTWFDFYEDEDVKFKIASTESSAYKKAIAKLSRKINPSKLRKNPTLMQQVTAAAMADAILIDFKGVTDKGKALKNTLENRKKLMEIPAIRDFIGEQSTDLANFETGGEAEDTASLKSDAGVAS